MGHIVLYDQNILVSFLRLEMRSPTLAKEARYSQYYIYFSRYSPSSSTSNPFLFAFPKAFPSSALIAPLLPGARPVEHLVGNQGFDACAQMSTLIPIIKTQTKTPFADTSLLRLVLACAKRLNSS
jgi:hypothetical protein